MKHATNEKSLKGRIYTLLHGIGGGVRQAFSAPGAQMPSREELSGEVASSGTDFLRGTLQGGLMLNPDEVITTLAPQKLGSSGKSITDAAALHRRMRRSDLKYKSLTETRKNAVLAKEWRVIPNPKDPNATRAADMAAFVESVLQDIPDFFADLEQLLNGIFCGYAVSENMWTEREVRFGDKTLFAWVIQELRQRRQGRFGFGEENELRLIRMPGTSEPVRPEQFVVHTHKPENENRNGTAESAEIFWYWFLKHNFVKWWCVYGEKFSQPTLVGKYKAGASKGDQDKLFDAIDAFQTEYGVVIPENVTIELLEAQRGGSLNTYQSFVEWCDRGMSEALTGQSLATGQATSGNGSFALGKEHAAVKQEFTESDCKELQVTINLQVVRPLIGFNFGWNVPPPIWVIDYEASDLSGDLEIDKTLVNEIGLDLPEEYFYAKYKRPMPSDKDKVVSGRKTAPALPGGGAFPGAPPEKPEKEKHSAGGALHFGAGGDRAKEGARRARELDKLGERLLPKTQKAYSAIGDAIAQEAEKCADLAELASRVKELEEGKQFTSVLVAARLQAQLNGYLLGAAQVMRFLGGEEPAKHASKKKDLLTFDPLPAEEAIAWFEELVPMTEADLKATYREAAARAFTAAGIEQREILVDMQALIAEVLRDGGTLQDWKANYQALREERGLGAEKNWRAEQIFRDATHRAYGAGRMRAAKDPELWANLMGFEYFSSNDDRTRPEHQALHGYIAAKDDPFWMSHFPPWEYGCRCVAVEVSMRAAEREQIELKPTVELDGAEVDPRDWPASPGFRGLGF